MAEIEGKKISGVPERTELTGNELYPFADSGSQGHVKGSVLKGYCATPIGEEEGTAFDGARGKAVEDVIGRLYTGYNDSYVANAGTSGGIIKFINDNPDYVSVRVHSVNLNEDIPNSYENRSIINHATTTNAGVMSANDKKNLDKVAGLFYNSTGRIALDDIEEMAENKTVYISKLDNNMPSIGMYGMSLDNKIENVTVTFAPSTQPDVFNGIALMSTYYPNLKSPEISYHNAITFITSGNGTKFLSDDGSYKQIDIPDTSNLATKTELSTKQDALVSGTNIKTVNGQSILGEGDITIEVPEGGITDAPSDGSTYGRNNGAWIKVEMPDVSEFITETEADEKYATPALVDSKVAALVNSAPAALDTLKELADALGNDANFSTTITTKLGEKVDKATYESDKAGFATKTELANKLDTSTYNSDKDDFATKDNLTTKQDALVSGTNIKTINNQSLLGEGNIDIAAGDSSVYYLDLSKYFTNLSLAGERYTGTISEEDISEINDSATSGKLIVGMISSENSYNLIPFKSVAGGPMLVLTGNIMDNNIYLQINLSTREYTGYYIGSSYQSDSSSTVTVSPLLDETIYITSSSSNPLNTINIESYRIHFRLCVQTSSQSVMLNIDGLNGVIGATFTGSKIALEANSEYEIDVKDNVAVVAKINKPQAQ